MAAPLSHHELKPSQNESLVKDENVHRLATTLPPTSSDAARPTMIGDSQADLSGVTTVVVPSGVDVQNERVSALGPQVSGAILPNQISTVAEYLGKPVMVRSGTWNFVDAVNTLLVDFDVFAALDGVSMWKDKLSGYFGMRMTTVIRVAINATPFHAGHLRLGYYPAPQVNPEKINQHNIHFTSFNQLPGVDVSCADESVILKIPYIAPARFMELTSTGRHSPGRVQLRVLMPLLGGSTSSAVTWNVWMHFEDVELFGQSYRLIAQSDRAKKSIRIRRAPRNPQEEEQTPVSSFLSQAALATRPLAAIPTIAPLLGPTQWMLNAASQVAGALGWSKPNHDSENNRVGTNIHWNMASATGMDNAQKMSLFSDNKLVTINDASPSDDDEMSINYVKKIWAPYQSFQLNSSNTIGQQVYSVELRPSQYVNASGSLRFHTPISFLGELFDLYRGSIEFKLKFAKTAFHAGQIQISFVPGPHDVTISLDQTRMAYRLIFDLQESDEICVRVPYVFPFDYFQRAINWGRMYVHVLTPLRAPDTTSQVIDTLVYVRGGDDLEFAAPSRYLAGGLGTEAPIPDIEAQGGNVEVEGTTCVTLGQEDPLASVAFASHAQGEQANSLLSLMKRYEPVNHLPNTVGYVEIMPWFISTLATTAQLGSPRHSLIMACYAFYRGGVKIRQCVTGAPVAPTIFAYQNDNTAATWVQNSPIVNGPTFPLNVVSAVPYAANSAGGAVTIPYHSKVRFSPTQYAFYSAPTTPTFTQPNGVVRFSDPGTTYFTYRAFDDDFQLLFFVGVPVLRVS